MLQMLLGVEVNSSILFIHEFLGCDTTSSIHGLGKRTPLKLMLADTLYQDQAQVFTNPRSTKSDIVAAGEAAFAILYKAPLWVSLDLLRFQYFHQKVITSKSFVDPQVLLPTSIASRFHSLRTYFQVQQWVGLGTNLRP